MQKQIFSLYCFFLLMGLGIPVQSQGTAQDSGWVSLIQPNFEGLYSFLKSRGINQSVHREAFSITPQSEIYCVPDSGHISTKKKYSHYRMRVEFQFGTQGPGAWGTNAGIMYHIDETWPYMEASSAPGPWWPRSIEGQLLTSEVGAVYSIQQVTFDVYVNGSKKYTPQGSGGSLKTSPTNSRSYKPSQNFYQNSGWTQMEIVVRGAERAEHWVQGNKVMEITDIRIPNPQNNSQYVPYGEGHIALQAEAKEIRYRNWEVMELHPDGPDRLPWLNMEVITLQKPLAPGQTFMVDWDASGQVDSILLEYSVDGTTWETLSNKATSPYSWTVSEESLAAQKLRISAWDGMVQREVAIEGNESAAATEYSNYFAYPEFTLYGKNNQRLLVENVSGPLVSVNILDIQGNRIRSLPIQGKGSVWDGMRDNGSLASLGVYFVQVKTTVGTHLYKLFHYK